MKSRYTPGTVQNVFATLSPDESLRVLSLSLAANDLLSNIEAIGKTPEGENSYFFYTSIAIVREVAKLVATTEKSTLSRKFSDGTWTLFKDLVTILAPYHNDSIVKSVLKPIRDVTFHYDLARSGDLARWTEIFQRTGELNSLDVGLVLDDQSLQGQRYTFADKLRSEYVDQFLTKEIVSRLSNVSVSIGVFVDSLLADLVHERECTEQTCGAHTP